MDFLRVLSGTANPDLAAKIANQLGVGITKSIVSRFSDGEIRVQITETVRGMDVFLIQPTCPPTSENILELLIMLDALKRASPRRVTAVIPYYGYARQEKKVKPREPIAARLMADLITTAGADRVFCIDLHTQTIQGFFNLPVDHLPAAPLFAEYFHNLGWSGDDTIIVSPDVGGVSRATEFGDRLGCDLAIIAKRRPAPNQSQVIDVIGNVEGKRVILIDDVVDTAGSLTNGAKALLERGATEIYACASHGVLSGPAMQRLEDSPIKKLVITDTIPQTSEKISDKIAVLSVAPMIADGIKRIHRDDSLSTIFDELWNEKNKIGVKKESID